MELPGRPWMASLVLAGVLAVGGCDIVTRPLEPLPTVRVTTDRDEYAQGEVARMAIVNVSEEAVEYNLCHRQLERQEGTRWMVSTEDMPGGELCAEETLVLAAGARTMVDVRLPPNLPPGRYRVRFQSISRGQGGSALPERDRTTNPFDVVAAPVP